MERFDLYGRIVYFDYCGRTEQGRIVDFVTSGENPIVTIEGESHSDGHKDGLKFRMPWRLSDLYLNPIEEIKELKERLKKYETQT